MLDAKGISEALSASAKWAREVIVANDGLMNLAECDQTFVRKLVELGVVTQDEIDEIDPNAGLLDQ